MQKVFVDTDVALDFLAAREPFYQSSIKLFSRADRGLVKLCISSLSFSNLNYLLAKPYGNGHARKILQTFKTLVTVLSVDDKTVELALASDFTDFEDALQYYCAIENGINILITRNTTDYKTAKIPVMTVDEFLS